MSRHDKSGLINWDDPNYEHIFDDQLSQYWDELKYDHWADVGNEATHLWNAIFADGIERDSAMDDFLSYVSIAGFNAAVMAIANIQKINRDDLMAQIDDYWASKK